MSTPHATPERVHSYPRFVRTGGSPAARNYRRLDPLAAMAGNALDLKHGERHTVPILAAT
jgi:hypothetical protein